MGVLGMLFLGFAEAMRSFLREAAIREQELVKAARETYLEMKRKREEEEREMNRVVSGGGVMDFC